MEPKRRLRLDAQAVSPVIGVILMVAIGVVLSGIIFVLVGGLSSKQQKDAAPTPVFQVDDINDKLSVISATVGADWTRIRVTATSCTTGGLINVGSAGATHENQAATIANTFTAISNSGCSGLDPQIQVDTSHAVIGAGDYLAFCVSGGTAANVNIQLTDTTSNVVLGNYPFTSIHQCV